MMHSQSKFDSMLQRVHMYLYLHTEQKDISNNICGAILPCSHPCGGVKGEDKCPPCITTGCGSNVNTSTTRDDNCAICYTDKLMDAPLLW